METVFFFYKIRNNSWIGRESNKVLCALYRCKVLLNTGPHQRKRDSFTENIDMPARIEIINEVKLVVATDATMVTISTVPFIDWMT